MSEERQVPLSAMVEAWPGPALVVEAQGCLVASNAAARAHFDQVPWTQPGLELKDLGLDASLPLSGPALIPGVGTLLEVRLSPLGGGLFLVSLRPQTPLDEQFMLLRNVMDSSADMIFVKDLQLRTILCNQAFAAALGKEPADVLGKTDLENGWDPELVKGNPAKGIRGFETDDRAALAGETIHNTSDPANVGIDIRIFDTIKLPLRNKVGQIIGILGIARDLTERKLLERDLREKERLLTESQRLAHLGCWSLNLPDQKVTWTEETYRVYGVDPEAFQPSLESLLGLVHPEDRAGIHVWIEACLAGQGPGPLELRTDRPDGSTRILSGQGHLVLNPQGEPLRMVGTVQDITEHKQSLAALQESQTQMRVLLEAANVGLWDWNLISNEVYFSPEWKRQLGYGEDELPNTFEEWEVRLHPEDREKTQAAVGAFLEGRNPTHEVEFRMRHRDGSWRWIFTKAEVFRNEAGTPVRMVGSHLDITDRKAMELTLKASEERFRRMLAASPVAFALNDEQGNITYLNEAFLRTFGYTLQDIPHLEAWWPRAYPDADYQAWVKSEWANRLVTAKTTGNPFQEMELDIRCKDGQVRTVRAGASSLDEAFAGNHLVTLLDVTAQKRAEEERRQFELHLQHTQKLDSLGSLAGGVAHDMNNVLAAILGIADLHQARSFEGESLYKDMDIVLKACVRGRALVQGLLDFARKGLGQVKVLDLNHLIQEEAALLERTTLRKISLRTELDLNLRYLVGDPAALSQALMNLCVNAVQAMPGGGTLTLRTRNEGEDFLILEVEDTGCGMSPEVAARAMDPFYTTKPAGEGTGLGLSMVYGTVKAHGGTVTLKSVPGRGTLVTLKLKALDAAPEQPPRSAPGPAAAGPELRILVVDDDELVLDTLERLLQHLGALPTRASSGPAALARLESGYAPDLIILDINMPGMDGFEVLEHIRTGWPGLRVLMTSGRLEERELERTLGDPGVRFIGKPFNLQQIKASLEGLAGPAKA